VKAAVGIAVQDGIQILNSPVADIQEAAGIAKQSQGAKHGRERTGNEPKRIGAYDENTLLAQSSTPATGDAGTDQTSEAPELQEVVVTGSMIARPTAETAEAVTTISVDTLKDEGITTPRSAAADHRQHDGQLLCDGLCVTTFEAAPHTPTCVASAPPGRWCYWMASAWRPTW